MSRKYKDKKYHYVYQITEISSGRMYIGARSSNSSPDKDLGIKYFSSSSDKEFISRQKLNRADGNTYNVAVDDPRYLSGEPVHLFVGLITVRDKNGNIFKVQKDDPRYLSGELVGSMKGTTSAYHVKDNKYIRVFPDDPRFVSGEIVKKVQPRKTKPF